MADEEQGEANNNADANEPRNEGFGDDHPFENNESLNLMGATGSVRYFNATSAQYSWSGWNQAEDEDGLAGARSHEEGRQRHPSEHEAEPEGHMSARRKDDALSFVWRSRDNRKGRHALLIRRGKDGKIRPHGTLEPTNTLPATVRGFVALFTRYPYWDISWWVAIMFTLGSLVWIANGFTVLFPTIGKDSSQAVSNASSWSALAGASLFFLGSYLLFLEAINANRNGCFGWAVERTIKGRGPEAEVHPGECQHHHYREKERLENSNDEEASESSHSAQVSDNQDDDAQDDDYQDDDNQAGQAYSGKPGTGSKDNILAQENEPEDDEHIHDWMWWPTWHDFRTHFMHEIGFIACNIQLISASLFWLSKFTTLPGISKYISQPVVDGTHWAPQIVGCVGFIVACVLFILETQQSWYLPAPSVLGWHVGFWKLIGCIGFALSAVFGPLGEHRMRFAESQTSISTFWGSWAILIGSIVQLYEALDKYPIIEEGTSSYSEWNRDFIEDNEKRRQSRENENEGGSERR
jgi:hypothetical protein